MTAVAVALTGADQQVLSAPGYYAGYAIRETAGATAEVRIFDGTSAAGVLLDTVVLAANGNASAFYPGGIRVTVGLFVDVISGTVAGSARIT